VIITVIYHEYKLCMRINPENSKLALQFREVASGICALRIKPGLLIGNYQPIYARSAYPAN
jgi:hypothetical protein